MRRRQNDGAGRNEEFEGRSNGGEVIKEFWTEHRVTLVAYQSQYIYNKRPQMDLQQNGGEEEKQKKMLRKKVDIEYESGFLSICEERSQQIKVQELVKEYQNLHELFTAKLGPNLEEVKIFVKIMLELKHSKIVTEFCELYNLVLQQLKNVNFEQVEKEHSRFVWLEKTKQNVLHYMVAYPQKFIILTQYLRDDEIATKKLILVEIYCLLAQKFNFNINEFYTEAFTLSTLQNRPSKKIKKSQ